MTDYISREAAIEAVEKHKDFMAKTGGVSNKGKMFYLIGQDHAIDVLRIVPAADVVPVVRGKWEYWAGGLQQCSVCKEEFCDYIPVGNFCPNCGADMRPRKEDDNE